MFQIVEQRTLVEARELADRRSRQVDGAQLTEAARLITPARDDRHGIGPARTELAQGRIGLQGVCRLEVQASWIGNVGNHSVEACKTAWAICSPRPCGK